jgi:SAM-dependent methyltransferase
LRTPDPLHRVRQSCRACDTEQLRMFLSLGPAPLANAFLRTSEDASRERWYPLDVYFCEECSLIQLADVVSREALFSEYRPTGGASELLSSHHERYAQTVFDQLQLKASDLVVDVGSNDGALLAHFQSLGVRTLGIEPARNVAETSQSRGIPTENQFFDGAAARELRARHGAARVVIGNNVLARVDDPRDFLAGCGDLLADGGLVIIEVPYVRDMVDRLEYGSIHHEHLCYFTVTTLVRLASAVGLDIVRVSRVPVHGGSLRVVFGRQGGHSPEVLRLLAEEQEHGLTSFGTYERFALGVFENRRQLRELLERLRAAGRTVAGYGAPAAGNTLLNYCGLSTDYIAYTVDANPTTQGAHTPGTHIPVFPSQTIDERKPDFVVILAWNFADEIMRQLASYRDNGGRFIIPIPTPRIV